MKYQHIARWFMESIWAIDPYKFGVMQNALAFLAAGGAFSPAEIEAVIGARPKPTDKPKGTGIAVLPLRGVIAHRAGMMNEASGGTSTETLSAQLQQYLADPEVGAIVLDVDSPGGTVTGVDELASEIYKARGTKPIVAVVNAMAASAAYWIASAASEITLTPSGQVGSIGVFAAHEDVSGQMERWGVKTTFISAGKYKTEGNAYEALTDEARAAVQSQVDDYYSMFTRAVANGRGVKVAQVREGYGEGRMVMAKDALASGMVDRIETMDETLQRLSLPRDSAMVRLAAKIEEPVLQAKIEEPERRSIVQEREWLDLQRLR